MVGNGPTLTQPLVPGILWVEVGHVPQASAGVCCGSKGISYFSQFAQLIHSVVLFLAPLSLPGPTEDSQWQREKPGQYSSGFCNFCLALD